MSMNGLTFESNTNPLERSQWSAGRGEDFIYCDFDVSEDGETYHIHIAFDGKDRGIPTTCDLLSVFVPKSEVVQTVVDATTGGTPGSVIEQWREMSGRLGQTPSPLRAIREYLKAVQESVS